MVDFTLNEKQLLPPEQTVFVEKVTHINIGDIVIYQKDNNIYIKKTGENGLISLKERYPVITSAMGFVY